MGFPESIAACASWHWLKPSQVPRHPWHCRYYVVVLAPDWVVAGQNPAYTLKVSDATVPSAPSGGFKGAGMALTVLSRQAPP